MNCSGKTGIAVLSGGLDSTVAMLSAIADGVTVVEALSFNYGQKHSVELIRAHNLCEAAGIPHTVVDLSSINSLLDSSLTREDIEVPKGHYAEENMKKTVVPNRNMIMTSIAAGRAMSKQVDYLILGVHQGDHAIYPDCRVEFIKALDTAIYLADWNKVELLTPVLHLDKAGIVKRAIKISVPDETLANAWTCYDPQIDSKGNYSPCGQCGSCTERHEAFCMNGKRDPQVDEERWEKEVIPKFANVIPSFEAKNINE